MGHASHSSCSHLQHSGFCCNTALALSGRGGGDGPDICQELSEPPLTPK